ncbi:hypothetical protein R3P38DRAFT_3195862 [Favolaschia claudopus]|uniref:Uncharacterized protein n=1 Tax=Favolaschia claudopus TaxID=2862362 RepID=A0AAW0B8T8_9AGAR
MPFLRSPIAPFWFIQRRSPTHSVSTVRLAFIIPPPVSRVPPSLIQFTMADWLVADYVLVASPTSSMATSFKASRSFPPPPFPPSLLPTRVYEENEFKRTIHVFPPPLSSHIPPFVPFAAAGLGRGATLMPVATDRPPQLSAARQDQTRTRAFQDAPLIISGSGLVVLDDDHTAVNTSHRYPPTQSISASDNLSVYSADDVQRKICVVGGPRMSSCIFISSSYLLPRSWGGTRSRGSCIRADWHRRMCFYALPLEGRCANKAGVRDTRKTPLPVHVVWHCAHLHLHLINDISPSSEARMPATTYLHLPLASSSLPRIRLMWGIHMYAKDDLEARHPAARHRRSAFLNL